MEQFRSATLSVSLDVQTGLCIGIGQEVGGATVAWQKNNGGLWEDIPGAVGNSYSTGPLDLDADGTQYRAVAYLPDLRAVSEVAEVTVTPDTEAPYLISAASADGRQVGATFNEVVDTSEFAPIRDPFAWAIVLEDGTELFVGSVAIRPDNQSVLLTISDFSGDAVGNFTVVAQQIFDLAGNLAEVTSVSGSRWLEDVVDLTGLGGDAPPVTHYTSVPGQIEISAGGDDMWGNDDEGGFAYKTVAGNFDVQVRVDDVPFVGNAWAKAGINVRNSTASNAGVLAWIYPTPISGANAVEFGRRRGDGAGIADVHGEVGQGRPAVNNSPVWVRVRRVGDLVTGYFSRDGMNWEVQGGLNRSETGFPFQMLVGLGVTSHVNATPTAAQFAQFQSYLSYPDAQITLDGPADVTVDNNNAATFVVNATVTGAPADELWYLWEVETSPGVFEVVPNAIGPSLTVPQPTLADDGIHYRVKVSAAGSNPVTSREALLSVIDDINPPYLVSAWGNSTFDEVTVNFNEPMDPNGGYLDPFAYEYVIGPAGELLPVLRVEPGVDQTQAILVLNTANLLIPDETHTAQVGPVADLSGNPVDGISTAQFQADAITPFVVRERWFNIGGVLVSDLTSQPAYPRSPDQVDYNSLLEGPLDSADNYGIRIKGFLKPKTSGSYDFYTSADDQGEFWLSTDANPANKVLVAREPVWNGSRNYTGTDRRDAAAPENRSTSLYPDGIPLVEGELYYFEALMKEGGGGDNISVAAVPFGSPAPANGSRPLGGEFEIVSGAPSQGASVTITDQPDTVIVPIGCDPGGGGGRPLNIGINLGSDEPSGSNGGVLAPGDQAGALPQINWNNAPGASGTLNDLVADDQGESVPTSVSVSWSGPVTWSSTGRGEENNAFPDGPDRNMLTGYLDSDNTAGGASVVNVSGLGPDFTENGYDVYVYCLGGVSGRGGYYTINGSQGKFGTSPANPSAHAEDPGLDGNDTGTYVLFEDLNADAFELRGDASVAGANFRAPINGLQIVAKIDTGGQAPQFVFDFEGGQPANTAVYGNARVADGALKLTDAANSLNGSFVMEDFTGGEPLTEFTAEFKVRMAESACCDGPRPADGMSFNFANDLPNAVFGPPVLPCCGPEDGAGTGLTISFDAWDNGPGNDTDAPAIEVLYGGSVVATVSLDGVREGGRAPLTAIPTDPATGLPMNMRTDDIGYANVKVRMDPDGTVDVWFKDVEVLSDVATGYTPTAGRFGFAGRTGGANQTHWVDDLVVTLAPPSAGSIDFEVVATGQTATDDNAPLFVQWNKDGAPIAGAHNLTLTAEVALADQGSLWSADIYTPGAMAVSDTATVIFDRAPQVAITSPPDGSVGSICGPVTITADATDPDGTVEMVEFVVEGLGTIGVDTDGSDGWSLTIDDPEAGVYVVTAVATDDLGVSCPSAPIMVELRNDPPVAGDTTVPVTEDTPTLIDVPASDPNGDALVVTILSGPANGTLSVEGGLTVLYSPAPNYCGPDAFTYQVSDPCGEVSGEGTVTIDVLPVADPPVCNDTSATTCEDQAVAITLPASDPDLGSCAGDAHTFAVVDAPQNGTVSISGNVATYQGYPDYNGSDAFTFQVTDSAGLVSGICTVTVTIQPGNDSPVAVIEVSPTVDLGPSVPGIIVLSPNNIGACVSLDGTQSSDVDNDYSDLTFTWLVNGEVVGTGDLLADICLAVGENEVTLQVDDGTGPAGDCDEPSLGETTVVVSVLKGSEATEELILQINDSVLVSRKNKQQFIATLKTADAAFERGSYGAGLNMLEALINKFEAQLKDDPQLQEEWIRIANEIITGMTQPVDCEGCTE